ncbi:MAG: tetratricopeptide repeat protein [Gaiellaceae bacterium]
MAQVADDPIQAGREALERSEWERAYELLTAADERGELDAEDIERLALAATFARSPEYSAPVMERAFAAWIEAGEPRRAAGHAIELAHYYGSVRLQRAIGNGWLTRAATLLADEPEGIEHGYLELQRSLLSLGKNDFETALAQAKLAEEVGARHGDRSLEIRGRQRRGMALVSIGEVEEGNALLDEAAVAAVSGELSPMATTAVYCNLIGACRDVGAYDQASQWTERATAFCDAHSLNAFPGLCRVNRAEVMRFEGRFDEAEATALQAHDELRPWAPRIAAAALNEIGEIRLRLGDLAHAEESFDQADELGRDPEPGRSLLLLARGKAQPAYAGIRRALSEDNMALPERARLLFAEVEIAVAAGELETGEKAAAELAEIAERYDTPTLRAQAQQAIGMVRLAGGDADAALSALRKSLRLWQEAGASYDVARARTVLGRAYRAAGDEEAALRELETAAATFDRLGAKLDSERVGELLGRDVGERVTKTFMFTDIVDSTKTLEAVGDEKWARALRWHDETLKQIFTANEGEVVDHTGDGFFVAFDDPRQAFDAATAVQRALAAQPLAPDVRVGIHADEATSLGANYRGKGVHTAARIGAVGGAAEIVASRATAEAANGVRASEPRSVELKGLAEPVELVTIDWR